MTLKQQIIDDVTDVMLDTDDFAETYTRYPEGRRVGEESVTAVFVPGAAKRQTELAHEEVTMGTLFYAATDGFDESDIWIINGRRWCVESERETVGGMRRVNLMLVESKGYKKTARRT